MYENRINYIYLMLDGGNATTFEEKEKSVLQIAKQTGLSLSELAKEASATEFPFSYNSEHE